MKYEGHPIKNETFSKAHWNYILLADDSHEIRGSSNKE